MTEKAKEIVKRYIEAHTDNLDYTLFVVWQAKILQNYKCLISTTIPRWTYFELTYDGDRKCWYFDVYRKFENQEIPDG